MQKIKSPKEAKSDLYKKGYSKKPLLQDSFSNEEVEEYYSRLFIKMERQGQCKMYETGLREKVIRMGNNNKELNVFYEDEKIITLPYEQLSKAVDKVIEGSKRYFWRTNIDNMSKLINYYVSGGLDKDWQEYEKRKRLYNKKP